MEEGFLQIAMGIILVIVFGLLLWAFLGLTVWLGPVLCLPGYCQ